MANYTSCKILVKQIEGQLDLESIKNQISFLKEQNNIYQTIKIYFDLQQTSFEMRFGLKWYPSTIEEIFTPNKFEIWVIVSDEGGASDYLKFYPSINSNISEFSEKALYKFDEIELRGETDKIFENLKEIFGWGINDSPRWNEGSFVKIKLNGIYKSNNYFSHEYDQKVYFIPVNNIPVNDEFNERTELWETIWDIDGIEFREKFYREFLNRPNGNTQFDYLESIQFRYKGKLTNIFEWNTNDEWSNWTHKAMNNYYNLVNTNYLMLKNK